MLQFNDLSLRRGPRLLFASAGFNIHPGQKVGVTGANGCGKSSLFALILGQLHADAGDYRMPKGWVISHVAQETPTDTRAAIEFVLDGDAELRQIEQALAAAEQADAGQQLAELHGHLDAIGGYQAEAKAGRLLQGLGFSSADEQRPVDAFSGGWRMRLSLARALMCRSDLLLLDEPTNHLDLDAVLWLEDWLRAYPGTLLLISHDRDFLDRVCDHIAHMEQQQINLYNGNYSAFERVRAERLSQQQEAYLKQQREISHILDYVNRFRAKASKARQAQSRLKALERMQTIAPAHVDSPFYFAFRPPEKTPSPLLKLEHIAVGYQGEPVISDLELTINPGDRVGLLGPNGAGKSTLIRLLASDLAPLQGQAEPARDLRIGYFAQHQLTQLVAAQSPIQHLRLQDPAADDQSLRDFLGGFGFSGDRAFEPVAPFSGGEKARLVLALLVYRRPNLLLLDEPTNHLDLEMRQALANALQDYLGALFVVSHDRHLLRLTCDRLLLVHGGRVEPFDEALDDYPRWLAEQRADQDKLPRQAVGHSAAARKSQRREQAERRQQLRPLTKQLHLLEKKMEALRQQQNELETRLADNELYSDERKVELKQLLVDKAKVDMALAQTEEAWLEAGEALDEVERALQEDP